MKYNFKAKETTEGIIAFIKNWFNQNGPGCNAVVGISGGKDSTIVAKLCVEALGSDRVIGVMLPNNHQHDLDVAKEVCQYLGIKSHLIDIASTFEDVRCSIEDETKKSLSEQALTNLAPRIRMTYLRAYAQCFNGRLINTSNLSEDWVGYATVDGDSAGDMSPLCLLTVQEVKAIGHYLGIPDKFVEKVPEDGLVGKSDEDNLGVTYAAIDKWIREGICDEKDLQVINKKFQANKFKIVKMAGMPCFWPEYDMLFEGTPDKEFVSKLGMAQDPRLQ